MEQQTLIKIYNEGEPIEVNELTEAITSEEMGAIVVFQGSVRARNRGQEVTHLSYEIYPRMLKKEARSIIAELRENYADESSLNVACGFRNGKVDPGEISTVIAAASPHREAAFKVCRQLLEEFKQNLPIWKKENYNNRSAWIEND